MSSKNVSSSSSSSSSSHTVDAIVVFGLAGRKGEESNSASGLEVPPKVGVRGKPGVVGDSDDDPSDNLDLDSAPAAILG